MPKSNLPGIEITSVAGKGRDLPSVGVVLPYCYGTQLHSVISPQFSNPSTVPFCTYEVNGLLVVCGDVCFTYQCGLVLQGVSLAGILGVSFSALTSIPATFLRALHKETPNSTTDLGVSHGRTQEDKSKHKTPENKSKSQHWRSSQKGFHTSTCAFGDHLSPTIHFIYAPDRKPLCLAHRSARMEDKSSKIETLMWRPVMKPFCPTTI